MALLFSEGSYVVHDLVLTKEKIGWMWDQMMKHPALSLEYGPPGMDGFVSMLLSPTNLYFEVFEDETSVGVLFMTDVLDPRLREIHAIFYDSSLSNKVKVCQRLAQYVFDHYGFPRLSAAIPESFGATARLLQKVGFKMEGRKVSAATIKGKPQDVLMFGLLPTYLKGELDASR